MTEPYAGYSGYPLQQGGWAGYPGAYPGHQQTAAYPAGYDYSSYYQQHPYYAYSSYYPQQQAVAESAAGATGTTVAPPPAPPADAPPPLPTEAPPPLPSGEALPPAPPADPDANTKAATVSASAAESRAAIAGTADARSAQAALAPQSVSLENAYAHYQPGQHQYQYGSYGQVAYAQGYGHPSYDYHSGQYLPSSTNPYASQVPLPSTPLPSVSNAAPQATATVQGFSTSLPPAAVTQGSFMPAAVTDSNSTPIGSGAVSNTSQASSLEAMKAAAEAVAQRLTATRGQGQPQYVSVGVAAAATNTGGTATDHSKDLPAALQQYVARALAVLGRSNETRLELRTVLRDAIAKHKKEGTLWSTDWDREPLPVLSKQARLSESIEVGGRQQQQRGGAIWDRLESSSAAQRQQADPQSPKCNRKRNRHRGYDDSDSSSGEDEGDAYGSWSRKQKVQLSGKKGKNQQVFEQHSKKGKKNKHKRWVAEPSDEWTAEEHAKHAARSLRFAGDGYAARSSTLAAYGWDDDSAALDDGEFIVGTCQKLEKRYLRLTRAPLPEEVRPQPVLAAALQRLLGMIESKADKYLYYNDQFKAMRQDLTVQGIKNEFTVQVYEAHARAALEYGDGAEYNQCQTQLAILYAAGLPGSHAEFAAYRLLYQSVHAAAGEGRKLLGTMRQLAGNKVGQVADSAEVQHAMQVRETLASSNISRFFRLYLSAPRLGRCLMDVAVKQLRWKALNTLVRAHKPGTLSLPFLATTFGFLLPKSDEFAAAGLGQSGSEPVSAAGSSAGVQQLRVQLAALTVDDEGKLLPGCSERSCCGENAPAEDLEQGLSACLEWCKKHGATFDDDMTGLSSCSLLTKDCWNKLLIPQDTTKVAHGDVNLDIRDFLAL